MATLLNRRSFIKESLLLASGLVVGASTLGSNAVEVAHADENAASMPSADYIAYLRSRSFNELALLALEEDGYWGMNTTALWEAYAFHYDDTYEIDGIVEHQWASNIASNPGLTTGWKCDNTLQGDRLIVFIQGFCGSGETDGIMGSRTIMAIQQCLKMPYCDGVFSGPSDAIRRMQNNFNEFNRPWR